MPATPATLPAAPATLPATPATFPTLLAIAASLPILIDDFWRRHVEAVHRDIDARPRRPRAADVHVRRSGHDLVQRRKRRNHTAAGRIQPVIHAPRSRFVVDQDREVRPEQDRPQRRQRNRRNGRRTTGRVLDMRVRNAQRHSGQRGRRERSESGGHAADQFRHLLVRSRASRAENRGQGIGYLAGNVRSRLRRGIECLSGGIGLLQSRGDRLLGVEWWRGLSRPGWRLGRFLGVLLLGNLVELVVLRVADVGDVISGDLRSRSSHATFQAHSASNCSSSSRISNS